MANLATAITLTLLLLMLGCASSVPRALDEVRPGQDKDSVLRSVGNPTRTFRENSQDHWLYLYYQKDQAWVREVIFDGGKVDRLTSAVATKEAWVKDLERTGSMTEYERKARAHQKVKGNP